MASRDEADLPWTDSNARRKDERLHKARSATAVKKLLFEVADHNTLDVNGDTPVHSYVKKQRFDCLMTFLIHSKCDVNLPNGEGYTALHLACRDNNLEAAKALIAFDAKINHIDVSRRRTALDIVLSQHNGSELEILLLLLGATTFDKLNDPQAEENGVFRGENDIVRALGFTEVNGSSEHVHNERGNLLHSGPDSGELTGSGGLASLPEEEESPVHKYYPTPDSSVEMGLTQLSAVLAKENTKGSLSNTSVTDDELVGNTTFIHKVASPQTPPPTTHHTVRSTEENITLDRDGNGSEEGEAVAAAAGGGTVQEMDADHVQLRQRKAPLPLQKAATSPNVFVHQLQHDNRQHVHFTERNGVSESSSSRQVRRSILRRSRVLDRQGSRRSLSEYNPRMEVMSSIIGESVFPVGSERQEGQRVLCLDGGGIKGLIQIELLKTIEQMTGKSISELFDWVVGTSTGGVLALGMIYGELSLSHLRRVYFDMKDTVFKRQSKLLSNICDTNALEKIIKGIFGTEMTMDCVRKPNVLIAAVNKTTTKLPLVFFNNCFNNEHSNELVWKVARYTSAAPVFFAECDNYVDGGVKANNPTTFGLAEIQDFLGGMYGRGSPAARISCVVSLGCGVYPPEPLGNTDIADALKIRKLHKIPARLRELLTLLTTAISSSEEFSRLCRINCEQQGISYFRFSPLIGEDVGTTEKDDHKLCQIIIRAKQIFQENEDQVEEMIQQLGCTVMDDYLRHI